jgi:dUTP pyrophosphatase
MKRNNTCPVVKIHFGGGGIVTIPNYQTSGASGMDISASKRTTIPAHGFGIVSTGLFLELPRGLEAQVRPRSGLAFNHGIGVLNSPGTIDSDYRGEIKVILFNMSHDSYVVQPCDRIAQLVFSRIIRIRMVRVQKLRPTKRGTGGFGHTGN